MPKRKTKPTQRGNRYQALLEKIFFDHYKPGATEVVFEREEFVAAAKKLKVKLPKNLGDAVYSVRYRIAMPARVIATQTEGREWVIVGQGRSRYAFRLAKVSRILPNENLVTIKIPEATPEIISAYALSDEQALLAKVRYNRLIDVFLGLSACSLQSHLRTSVKDIGQIEVDEVYVGVDRDGRQYVIPVQAKGGNDKLGAVQTEQDIAFCRDKFPELICRPISAQFMADDLIALFELTIEDDEIKIVDEVHYRLVPADQISREELAAYRARKTRG
ncbi:endonuclease [Oleiharenicola sp. Vm1]|uniref:endonuclease n=1 Tax=Oleiharenicola sp. Vm1 TaxID=3398393 RepID=UPI0039F458D4